MDVSQEFQRVRTYCILGVCVNVTIVFPLAEAREDPVCVQYFSHQQARPQ